MAKSLKHILKKRAAFKVNGSLWIECDGNPFFGPGPVELLERIVDTGSINQAAKAMKMSYKKAWEIIHVLNEQLARPAVITKSGGEKGGGSIVTDRALALIKYTAACENGLKGFWRMKQKH